MMLLAADEEVVVIEDEPLDVGDFVKRFAGNFLDFVVGHVHHLELFAIVNDPEDVPVEEGDVVAVEN